MVIVFVLTLLLIWSCLLIFILWLDNNIQYLCYLYFGWKCHEVSHVNKLNDQVIALFLESRLISCIYIFILIHLVTNQTFSYSHPSSNPLLVVCASQWIQLWMNPHHITSAINCLNCLSLFRHIWWRYLTMTWLTFFECILFWQS